MLATFFTATQSISLASLLLPVFQHSSMIVFYKILGNKKPLQANAYKGLNLVGPVGLEPTTKGL